jgi:hypothetical protein
VVVFLLTLLMATQVAPLYKMYAAHYRLAHYKFWGPTISGFYAFI